MRRYPVLLFALSLLAFTWSALAQDAAPVPDPANPFGAIANASPPVAVALALAYGAYQVGAAVTRLGLIVERLLERGVPIRVELAEREREILDELVPAQRPRRAGGA